MSQADPGDWPGMLTWAQTPSQARAATPSLHLPSLLQVLAMRPAGLVIGPWYGVSDGHATSLPRAPQCCNYGDNAQEEELKQARVEAECLEPANPGRNKMRGFREGSTRCDQAGMNEGF